MQNPKQVFERLESSPEFKDFKKENPISYLSSFALMVAINELEKKPWHVNFYLPETKKMMTFIMDEQIELKKNQDILKKGKIMELKLEEVKTSFADILAKSKEIYKHQGMEDAQTAVIMLQQAESPIWTVTFVTATMKMLSIQIDAQSGEELDVKKSNFSYRFQKN